MNFFAVVAVGMVEEGILSVVEGCLRSAFGVEVRRVEPLPEPVYAFDARRGQYSSIPILHELVEKCPADALKLLAVTEKDLFIPMLSFIYGQAQLGGKIAMISLARLRQEFYGLPDHPSTLLERARKEALHEVGHTFNLTHCAGRSCTMCLSTNIRQLDLKAGRFCKSCEILLRESIETI